MTTISQNCMFCQVEFQASVREIKRGNAKFCSISCSSKNAAAGRTKPNPNVVCAFCSEPFYLNPSKQRNSKSGFFFCCREHKDKAQRIGGIKEIMPPHYGTSTGSCPEYRKKAFALLPNECKMCGWDKYPNVLEVNHIDCNRNNNDIQNLEILCPTCHAVYHFTTKTGKWRERVV